MKNSSKFMFIILIAIIILMVVLIVMFRSMVSDHIVVSAEGDGFRFNADKGPVLTETFKLDDFSRIEVRGGWDILVFRSEDFGVTVDYDQDTDEDLVVEKRGDTLYLGLPLARSGKLSDFHGASATIYMPDLEAVEVDGAVNLNVENFTGDELRFLLNGAGQIISENCSYGHFDLDSKGALHVDFTGSEINSADVNIDGAGNVMLNMTGGELSGVLSGLANLEYRGDVSSMTVRKDGISNIEYKN